MTSVIVYKFNELKLNEMFVIARSTKVDAAIYRKVMTKRVPPTNAECVPMVLEDGTEARGRIIRCFIQDDTDCIVAK